MTREVFFSPGDEVKHGCPPFSYVQVRVWPLDPNMPSISR